LPSHHMVRHTQTLRAVPARAIQHEHDLLGRTRTHGGGKGGEFRFKGGHAHRGGEVKDGATGGGMHKAHEVAPLIPMLDRSEGTLVVQSPDLAQDGFQANAMLVHGPQLNRGVRKGRRHLTQQGA
jgi:hypothetical protein